MRAMLVATTVFAVFVAANPLSGQQAAPANPQADHQHDAAAPDKAAPSNQATSQMMAAMKARDQKLDELVKKMNAAKGTDKVDAIAALLTTLVEDHRSMHHMMMTDMPMMQMMMQQHGMGMSGRGNADPSPAR